MSRSGYTDDYDENGTGGLWRGAVASAMRGARGQAFLHEMAAAMDAMPIKELHAEVLAEPNGCMCAMGTVAAARGLDVSKIDPENRRAVSKALGIAPAMAAEIAYENDEGAWEPSNETPAARWQRMRQWIASQIKAP